MISTATRRKFRKLATFLETKVKPGWFDLNLWATGGFPEKECGSTACACGWATVCFPKSGLSFRDKCDGIVLEICWKPKKKGKTYSGGDAIGRFFDIDNISVQRLFSPTHYSGGGQKETVIKRLREAARTGLITTPNLWKPGGVVHKMSRYSSSDDYEI